jgi:hypothetical protein
MLCPAGRWIPTRPKLRWRICRKAYSLRLCALRQGHLSLTSLPCGARLSAPSPSPRRSTVAASPHHLWPPHAARPPTSRCQAKSSLPALIPPLNPPPPLTPHQATPPSMALRPLPPVVSPSLTPACPSSATIKGGGAPPPRPSPHSLRPHLHAPEFATSNPPSASSAGCSPPSPSRVRPSTPPLAAGEAHCRLLPLFPQPRRGSTHGGAVPAVLRRAASEAVPAVHRTVDSVHGIFR